MVSVSGEEFVPGTYYHERESENWKVAVDLAAEVNNKYPVERIGRDLAWFHTERKMVLALRSLFDLSQMELLQVVSGIEFCDSCINIFRNLEDEFEASIKHDRTTRTEHYIRFDQRA